MSTISTDHKYFNKLIMAEYVRCEESKLRIFWYNDKQLCYEDKINFFILKDNNQIRRQI